jgi:ASTRA-associated protein 1
VWKIRRRDEDLLGKGLPVEAERDSGGRTPWLLHSLSVNALNFCAFSLCFIPRFGAAPAAATDTTTNENDCGNRDDHDIDNNDIDDVGERINSTGTTREGKGEITVSQRQSLIAVPNALDSGGIDIFHLPSERRVSTILTDEETSKTGMVMAVNIFISRPGILYVLSGYEDGHVMVHAWRLDPFFPFRDLTHSSSSPSSWKWNRLYSSRPHSQPVLSLHVSPAYEYFLTSAADAFIVKHPIPSLPTAGSCHSAPLQPAAERDTPFSVPPPIKVENTKHAGQQGLRVRSDGKVFATAGWDARIRVYSCKAVKELAVLKWHKEGCYTVAFAEVGLEHKSKLGPNTEAYNEAGEAGHSLTLTQSEKAISRGSVRHQRSQRAQLTHWLAAGSKDGKITLWDIY